jgi:hypothetical protein
MPIVEHNEAFYATLKLAISKAAEVLYRKASWRANKEYISRSETVVGTGSVRLKRPGKRVAAKDAAYIEVTLTLLVPETVSDTMLSNGVNSQEFIARIFKMAAIKDLELQKQGQEPAAKGNDRHRNTLSDEPLPYDRINFSGVPVILKLANCTVKADLRFSSEVVRALVEG